MKRFSELLERVKKLEEVVLELQQRVGMVEQADQRRYDAVQRVSARARRRRAKHGELEGRRGAKSPDR